jgi:hypothetical protein
MFYITRVFYNMSTAEQVKHFKLGYFTSPSGPISPSPSGGPIIPLAMQKIERRVTR